MEGRDVPITLLAPGEGVDMKLLNPFALSRTDGERKFPEVVVKHQLAVTSRQQYRDGLEERWFVAVGQKRREFEEDRWLGHINPFSAAHDDFAVVPVCIDLDEL